MPENSQHDSPSHSTHDAGNIGKTENHRRQYVGRFAPSPSGPLHLGSIVAAVASLLDARAHGGRWLIRMEDIDGPREQAGAAEAITRSLHDLQMFADEPILWQSKRSPAYERALHTLITKSLVYPCTCSRKTILNTISQRDGTAPATHTGAGNIIYPGTCRDKPLSDSSQSPETAFRLRVSTNEIHWADRTAGFQSGKTQSANLAESIGDFILKRRDGLWAYQLAVVVDDAFSEISDTVRGDDLAESTARQVYLQDCLGLDKQRTLHIPVVVDLNGQKLSKQQGAPAAITDGPLESRIALLNQAIVHLGLTPINNATDLEQFWAEATQQWANSLWMAS